MTAGRYRHPVTIQQDTGSKNATGGRDANWTTFAERYAEIRPLTGSERMEAAQAESTVTHEVRMRYDSTTDGIKPSMRVLYGSRVFAIESAINVDERGRELLLQCRETVR